MVPLSPPSAEGTASDKLLSLTQAVSSSGLSAVLDASNEAPTFGEAAGEPAFSLSSSPSPPSSLPPQHSSSSSLQTPSASLETHAQPTYLPAGSAGAISHELALGGPGALPAPQGLPGALPAGAMGAVGGGVPEGGWVRLVDGWPTMDHTAGRRILALSEQPGIVRHDIRVAKPIVGRLIGAGGSTFRDLTARTGAHIFVLDKEGPPPGWTADWRLVILMGYEQQVIHANAEVEALIGSSPMLSGPGTRPAGALGMAAGLPSPGRVGTAYGGFGAGAQALAASSGGPGVSTVDPAGPSAMPASLGQILVTGWPTAAEPSGRRMAALEQTPGMMRHDILVGKPYVGRLIGQGGSTYRELQQKTGCNIFILDKEGPPPGFADDQRLIVLMGYEAQVVHANAEVEALLSSSLARPPVRGGAGAGMRGGAAGMGGAGYGGMPLFSPPPAAPFCDPSGMGGAYGGYGGAPVAGYATGGYGGYGGADPYSAPGGYAGLGGGGYAGAGAGYGAAGAGYGAAGAGYGAAGAGFAGYGAAAGGGPAYYNEGNSGHFMGSGYADYEQRGTKRTAYEGA